MVIRCTARDQVEEVEDVGVEDLEMEMDTADMVVQMLESKIGTFQGLINRWEEVREDLDADAKGGEGKSAVRKEIWEMCGTYLQGENFSLIGGKRGKKRMDADDGVVGW